MRRRAGNRTSSRWSAPACSGAVTMRLAAGWAPLDHVGPEDLTIERLLERVKDEQAREIILALGADVEGEATAQYLAGLLKETFPM